MWSIYLFFRFEEAFNLIPGCHNVNYVCTSAVTATQSKNVMPSSGFLYPLAHVV